MQHRYCKFIIYYKLKNDFMIKKDVYLPGFLLSIFGFLSIVADILSLAEIPWLKDVSGTEIYLIYE